MYEEHRCHLWGPGTQADAISPEQLRPAGRLIDQDDPALREILQALTSLAGNLGSIADPDEDTVRMAIRLGRARFVRMESGEEPPRGAPAVERVDGWIYYIRRGPMVKIGTTVDLYRRMSALLPEEVLATEPGSHAKELELHRRFSALRVPGQREWFYAGPELQAHVEEVLDRNGPPPADLPTLPSSGASWSREQTR
ncbi:GIY-YIG nuclease family protein [Streptomyces rubiginosohelvolus]